MTHYKQKLGSADNTDCSSSVGYSSEAAITAGIYHDYAAYADGLMRLCVRGRTSTGNWQDLSLAFRYDWILDRTMPGEPSNLNIVPLVSRNRLSWDAVPHADTYLVIRSENPVTWTPSSGQSYASGDDIDGGQHHVVGVSASLQMFDETAQGGQPYHYALFALDKALNYNENPSRASSTAIEPLEFSKADGFDRLVRVVLPILEGEHTGKVLVGGDFVVYQQDPAIRLLRLNADFTLDRSFKPALINGSVYSLALASDGSIYMGGSFSNVGGKVRNRLARLTPAGDLDENFIAAGLNNTVMTLALSHDEARLYVGGSFTALTSTPATAMNRLAALRTADGQLDSNFTLKHSAELNRLGFNSTVWTILPEPGSSEIYVGGQFTDYGGVTTARLVKLTDAGDIDTSLSLGAGFDSTVVTLKMDSRQRLYVGGSFGRYRGSSYYARFVRLKSDGMPDTDFSKGLSTSPRFNSTVYAIEVDEANQKIYVGGDFTLYGTAPLTRLARLSMADGSLDTSLVTGTSGTLQTLRLTDTGKLIGGGNFQRYAGESTAFFFAASGTDGALDPASPRGSNLNSYVYATARLYENPAQPRESVQYFLAGSFTTYNGEIANRVVKVDRKGNRDKTFNSQVTNGNVYAMAWDDSEKKLYVGGTFTQVNGIARNRIARLNADGSLDSSFVPDGFDSDVYAIALASMPGAGSRVIYVGGKFTKNGTAAAARLIRLTADGKLDPNFATGTGFDNNVAALAVVPGTDDHMVFVGGSFTKYNSAVGNAPRLVKLASDGSLASGFEPGSGFNGSVQALLWMPTEGALYVGGAFSRYQSTIVANRIAKLESTGGMATGFNATGFNSTVYALDYDTDNDLIWAGGAFTTFRGITQGRMAAMGRDGSRVAAFNAPIGFNGDVRAIVSSFWGVIAGGLGSSFEGDVCGFVARLHVNATMD
ncbi:MAG TPA: delta-60 repeat domain-containing protein [Oligoflexus sp.]|nr:delta-60 repeat domain-containing protein [Oligoflexus sp.]